MIRKPGIVGGASPPRLLGGGGEGRVVCALAQHDTSRTCIGELRVVSFPTADNASDLLTKCLNSETYHRHRKTLMNLSK